jgi:hypothetical protein
MNMGGGTGTGGVDPRWVRIQELKAEIAALKKEMRHHAPRAEDYGVWESYPTGRVPGAPDPGLANLVEKGGPQHVPLSGIKGPTVESCVEALRAIGKEIREAATTIGKGPGPPPPPPESDPAGPHSRWAFACCWKGMLWPWHRCPPPFPRIQEEMARLFREYLRDPDAWKRG